MRNALEKVVDKAKGKCYIQEYFSENEVFMR
jgi:hypothetical protein